MFPVWHVARLVAVVVESILEAIQNCVWVYVCVCMGMCMGVRGCHWENTSGFAWIEHHIVFFE